MRPSRAVLFGGALALGALTFTSCSSGGSSSSSSSTTSASSHVTAPASDTSDSDAAAGGGWPGAHGCDSPSSDAIGSALGTPIAKNIRAADQGCLWESATVGFGVQVSYHTPTQDPMKPAQLSFLRSTGTITDLTIPGTTSGFLRKLTLAGHESTGAYLIYPEGQLQIMFNNPPGAVSQDQVIAVVKLIAGVS